MPILVAIEIILINIHIIRTHFVTGRVLPFNDRVRNQGLAMIEYKLKNQVEEEP